MAETSSTVKKIQKLLQELTDDEQAQILRQLEIMLHNRKVKSEFAENIKRREKQKKEDVIENLSVKIIESEDAKSFRFFFGDFPKMFMLDEMRKLVKLCHSSNDGDDAAKRLERWMKSNRQDFFMDIHVQDKPLLFKNMYNAIIGSYTVKG